jgi:hypothetical protein
LARTGGVLPERREHGDLALEERSLDCDARLRFAKENKRARVFARDDSSCFKQPKVREEHLVAASAVGSAGGS